MQTFVTGNDQPLIHQRVRNLDVRLARLARFLPIPSGRSSTKIPATIQQYATKNPATTHWHQQSTCTRKNPPIISHEFPIGGLGEKTALCPTRNAADVLSSNRLRKKWSGMSCGVDEVSGRPETKGFFKPRNHSYRWPWCFPEASNVDAGESWIYDLCFKLAQRVDMKLCQETLDRDVEDTKAGATEPIARSWWIHPIISHPFFVFPATVLCSLGSCANLLVQQGETKHWAPKVLSTAETLFLPSLVTCSFWEIYESAVFCNGGGVNYAHALLVMLGGVFVGSIAIAARLRSCGAATGMVDGCWRYELMWRWRVGYFFGTRVKSEELAPEEAVWIVHFSFF